MALLGEPATSSRRRTDGVVLTPADEAVLARLRAGRVAVAGRMSRRPMDLDTRLDGMDARLGPTDE